MNARRGNETTYHLEAKTTLGRLFKDPEWAVFYEERNADILVMHIATRFVAAIEVESSPKHVRRNLERDATNGCNAVAVVALNRRHIAPITDKAVKHAIGHPGAGVMVFTHDSQGHQALRNWFTGIARFKKAETGNSR